MRLLAILFWSVVVLMFFPILVVLPMAVGETDYIRFPPVGFTGQWFVQFLTEPRWVEATLLSGRVALAAAGVATVAGLLAAIPLRRQLRRWQPVLDPLLLAPMIVPGIVLGLGAYIVLARLRWLESEVALVLLHAVLGLPFTATILGAALSQVDQTPERAARVCGAAPVRAFTSVTLPALAGPLASALLFAFFVSFDELAVSLFVMGGKPTLPMLIWADLRLQFSPVITAAAAVLVLLSVGGLSLAELLRRR